MKNVTAFPIYDIHNIPEALRQLANKIEYGDLSAVRCVVVLETESGAVDYAAFGAEPFTVGHAVGLCFCGAQVVSS